jgi:hypothetical protein
MTATIEIDDYTHRSLAFAARMSNTTPGQVVARLVEQASMPQPAAKDQEVTSEPLIAIFADYQGQRTHATYDPATTRVDITSEPLRGRSFKTPTGAAKAVVKHYNPHVSSNRNGWDFWTLDDGTRRSLQSIRCA